MARSNCDLLVRGLWLQGGVPAGLWPIVTVGHCPPLGHDTRLLTGPRIYLHLRKGNSAPKRADANSAATGNAEIFQRILRDPSPFLLAASRLPLRHRLGSQIPSSRVDTTRWHDQGCACPPPVDGRCISGYDGSSYTLEKCKAPLWRLGLARKSAV
jgi:hypothetical protein